MSAELNTHRILVIDDNPSIHEDFRKVLGNAPVTEATSAINDMEAALFGGDEEEQQPIYEIDSAHQGREGLEKISAAIAEGRPYSMVFSDMRMPPGMDGVQTLREIWKLSPRMQAAICTAYSDYTPEQITREIGVSKRMVIVRKPFDCAEIRQLTAMICDKADVARQRAELANAVDSRLADLKHAANHDGLTGLANRRLFSERLAQALIHGKKHPHYCVAVVFIDCDNFKNVNDTMGHQAGDQLLLQISGRLKKVLSESMAIRCVETDEASDAIAARIGGDEFAILLDGIRCEEDATRVAQRLLDVASVPYPIQGRQVRSGMSLGITTSKIAYASAEEMLRDADTAMYQAKRGGKSRFVLFDQAMHDAAVARSTAETELRGAIEAGQVRPYFQPIINTETRSLVGFEALARWHHPTRGTVMPADFIPFAEETGIIVTLGLRILEESCTQLVKWQKAFPTLSHMTMSVNISRKQLASTTFVDQVVEIIDRTGVSPRYLKLEITESAVMDNSRSAVEVLERLKSLGVQLQMDDFGSGYSSLSNLRDFPLSGIKIDRSFMENSSNEASAKILNAIASLAQDLKLPLVAEGVESPEQLMQLRSLGCDFAQGYLFARPMDSEAATAFLMGMASPVSRAA